MKQPLPTLRVSKYRGKKYWIRHLFGETFEIIVPAYGNLHSHTHLFTREKRLKRAPYQKQELAAVTHALNELAHVLIDDIIFQHRASRFERWLETLKGRGRWIQYQIGELLDKLNYKLKYGFTGKSQRKAGEGYRGDSESIPQLAGQHEGDGEEPLLERID